MAGPKRPTFNFIYERFKNNKIKYARCCRITGPGRNTSLYEYPSMCFENTYTYIHIYVPLFTGQDIKTQWPVPVNIAPYVDEEYSTRSQKRTHWSRCMDCKINIYVNMVTRPYRKWNKTNNSLIALANAYLHIYIHFFFLFWKPVEFVSVAIVKILDIRSSRACTRRLLNISNGW